jgi:hypothetical protein
VVQWLRRRFVTGFVVTVPLVISLVALVFVWRSFYGMRIGSASARGGREPLALRSHSGYPGVSGTPTCPVESDGRFRRSGV